MATADYLVIAGGGGGGSYRGGGGGAGGYQKLTSQTITAGTYTVTVGAGGAGATGSPYEGTKGGDSSFNGTTSNGGGGGGGDNGAPPSGTLGSGGGAANNGGTGATGTGGQGNNGGNPDYSAPGYGPGGGGGAGAVGANGTSTQGGNGGNGTADSITGSSVTRAGGGGGGIFQGSGRVGGSGGTGGGGTGATSSANATAGTANTGGGGGGGAYSSNLNGAAGGSGVVIVRLLTSNWFSITGGTQTIDGLYTVCTFNSSADLVLAGYNNTHSLTTSSLNAKRTTNNFTSYGTSAVTVMAWVKTSTDNSTAMVVNINDGSNSTFQIIKVTNDYRFDLDTTTPVNSALIPEASVETGNWVHLAGTYDGANVKIFLNGTQYGSNVAKTGNIRTGSPTRLGIGVRSTGADLPFVGQIDDVKIFNIALTGAEITSYMSDCNFSRATTGLTGWWTLDNTNADSQINITANDLVSVGSPSFTTDPAYSCSVATVNSGFFRLM